MTRHAARSRTAPASRGGFTLVEALTVLGVVGLLLALLLPAVQASREAARAAACQNNLKQIGLACYDFEALHRALPAGSDENWYSPFALLTPHIGEGAVAAQIDFTVMQPVWAVAYFNRHRALGGLPMPPVFACPGEGGGEQSLLGYAASLGSSWAFFERNGAFRTFSDAFGRPPAGLALAEFRDGLSQTAVMTERTAAPYSPQPQPGTPDATAVSVGKYQYGVGLRAAFVADCLSVPDADLVPASGGRAWVTLAHNGTYLHVLPPNTRHCFNGRAAYEAASANLVPTASSPHPGRVHSLFADGSVRPITDGIDLSLWAAVGSIDGGEAVSF